MPNRLSLSRAARIAGVSRGDLQNRIREQDAETFEGQITIEALLALYPHIDLNADPTLERVQRLRTEAKPKRHYSDGWLPDPAVLMERLKEFQHILVQTKSALNAAEELLNGTVEELIDITRSPDAEVKERLGLYIEHLQKTMQRVERVDDARAQLFAQNAMLKVVTANVRLLPSGHEILIEGDDSILDAGLKAGLHMNYGCSSGNCGACKCKVLQGAVRKLRDHDYIISSKEQEQGYILACSNTAISDLVIEASEAGWDEELPHQEIRVTVRKVEPVSENLMLLQVQTPRTHSLRFKAGQQVKLTAENGGTADLFIASCPCDGRNLQFLCGRKAGHPFCDSLFDGTIAKQTLLIEGPSGGFVLHEDSTTPVLFVSMGLGIAPVKSLVEQAITIDNAERIGLLQVGTIQPGSSLENLCRSWNDSLDNFNYVQLTEDSPLDVQVDAMRKLLNGYADTEVYVAGPAKWLETLSEEARISGLDTQAWTQQPID